MALVRLANKTNITQTGNVYFYAVTDNVIFLKWQNSLGHWVTFKAIKSNEAFNVFIEDGVNWRFDIFGDNSYVEVFE